MTLRGVGQTLLHAMLCVPLACWQGRCSDMEETLRCVTILASRAAKEDEQDRGW